jgi:hypothetical protein
MGLRSRTLVTGAGGFIGHHLVKRLKAEGHWGQRRPESWIICCSATTSNNVPFTSLASDRCSPGIGVT